MFNRFYYRGFQPTGELQAATAALLDTLREGGPADGAFLGSVEAVPEGYLARLDLYSIHGPFLADSTSHDARSAIEAVIAKIEEQLSLWRENRRESPGAARKEAQIQ